eukprot:771828-Amphidinium_carterae.2
MWHQDFPFCKRPSEWGERAVSYTCIEIPRFTSVFRLTETSQVDAVIASLTDSTNCEWKG